MRLTEAQRVTLDRMATLRLPDSMQDWPGFPYNMLDMRSVEALVRRGLVEGVMRTVSGRMSHRCYRITPAGRAALKENDGG